MSFALDERLEATSYLAGYHGNIQLRIADDARYLWCLLIPEQNDVCEIHDLADDEQRNLMRLAIGLGSWLKLRTEADKVNTAAIGNVVPQLHLHVVCRNRNDAVWPAPIWGNGEPAPLNETMLQGHITLIKAFLEETALR